MNKSRSKLWLGAGVSALALLTIVMSAEAQDTAPAATGDTSAASGDETVVVVTARRKALQTATERKKNSDTMIDSVVADEAGKLPDNSITEVLQRVSGVSIVRFGSLGDPDHFSAEGSGIQVRGLSGVAGLLNGREVFSANGGQGLLWGDVTPELMSAVDVYKDSTADRLIGGTGGAIDLRTKMPFDYKKPAFQASIGDSYGDLVKKHTPSASFLVTDRWDTPIGEVGALVDLAYSKFSSHDNFIRAEPFYKTQVQGVDRYIPGGFDYGWDDFNRERTGVYAAFQWKPSDTLQFYTTLFSSKYEADNTGGGEFVVSQNMTVDPTGHNVFDSSGALISSDKLTTYNANDGSLNGAPLGVGGDTGRNNSDHTTSDWTTGFSWQPNDRTKVSGAIQFVDSESHSKSYDLFPSISYPGTFGIDLSGKLPKITLPANAATLFGDPAAYHIGADMTHIESNHGTMGAGNFDVDWALSDTGFIRDIKWGARYASRVERDDVSGYNWSNVCQGWDGCDNSYDSPTSFAHAHQESDVGQAGFQNFFRGQIPLPGNLFTASNELVTMFDPTYIRKYYGIGSGSNIITLRDSDYAHGVDKTTEAYVMARFASDTGWFGVPFTGNFGIRFAQVDHESQGSFVNYGSVLNTTTNTYSPAYFNNGTPYYLLPGSHLQSGGRKTTRALPSFNIAFAPDPTVKVRFAFNTTMDLPSYTATKATGGNGVSLDTTNPTMPTLKGFSTNAGNPQLKPMFSDNLDLSLEWYKSNSFNAHLALFHKDIKNIMVYGTSLVQTPFTYIDVNGNNPTIKMEQAVSTNTYNSAESATISGYEIGVRKFFDQLPSPWDGLGFETNYTYINSHNPGDVSHDINGVTHFDTPITGMSPHNFNLTTMYEKGPWSARVAYSWRSRYLMSTNSNGTASTYTYHDYANGTSSATLFALPLYSASYGQIDLGGSYRFNDHIIVSLEASNVTDAIPRTLQGGYPNGDLLPRSWFIADRRVNLSVRFSY